ncbi:hypothetical protein ABZ599_15925 [Streptomyces misionensis]|uniref:hypothetical protein n=1 Tax=Streptomyces misionensis TaxID=67331 RepID=UPI00340A6689
MTAARFARAKAHWRAPGAERLGQWSGRSTVGADACQAVVDIAVNGDRSPAA